MTDSNAIHSTITKQPNPTKFSDLEPKASSKDEFLKSFTNSKLRKNAKKKIAQLLAYAYTVTLETQWVWMIVFVTMSQYQCLSRTFGRGMSANIRTW